MSDFKRAVTFTDGTAIVITDLHGSSAAYDHLRDLFLKQHAAGDVQHLILCGDLIHGYGSPADDASLQMLLDVMCLQNELGAETVIMLCGNHEMPHIYGMPLSRGNIEYTPRFEHALTELDQNEDAPYTRTDVIDFLTELPFYAFTAAGVMISHAGPIRQINTPEIAEQVLNFDHRAFLQQIDTELQRYDLAHARQLYATQMGIDYDKLARHYLAVTDETDPRYNHLLRSFVWGDDDTFQLLWDTLFTRNEQELPNDMRRYVTYSNIVQEFLKSMSAHLPAYPQHIVVSGHIAVSGGHEVVDDYHLRLASYQHAQPHDAGEYLLLDCAAPVENADALVPMLHRTFDS